MTPLNTCSLEYYFLGAVDENNQSLYELVQEAGFILTFREHSQAMVGKKKGNVDTDIVFTVMAKIAYGNINEYQNWIFFIYVCYNH